MNKTAYAILLLVVLSAVASAHHPRPPFVLPPWFRPPVVEEPSCPGGDPTQPVSTCCPSHPWEPDVYPPGCDHYPVDPRYATNTCEYHESTSGIPCSVREHFMELAMNYTFTDSGSACPAFPFGAIIVNHTGPSIAEGDVIAIGRNLMFENGSPIWHGEMTAIEYAAAELAIRFGRPVPRDTDIWHQLTMYTTGEPCPMCAGAIRYAKFGELVQAVPIDDLNLGGYYQPNIRMWDVQQKTNWCQYGSENQDYETSLQTRVIVDVLRDEIAPYFFARKAPYPCPPGCHRPNPGDYCTDI